VSELFSVAAEVHLIVGLVERAEGSEQLTFLIALETRSRDRVEYTIGTVAVSRRVSAALGFEVIDVLRIDLRADIAGNIRIGNRNAVDGPGYLMSTANMQLVVRDPRARDIIGDRTQTVA